ncbi:MAG: hypothetical protein WAM70_08045 [Pyrinomonadaceae bacterium]
MSEEGRKSAAAEFLDEHPELRAFMTASEKFRDIKKRKSLVIDGEQLYVVQGDMQGDEDDLFVDTIVRGSNSATREELARSLFLELNDRQKDLIMKRFTK